MLVLLIAIAAQATLMATVNIDRQTGSGFAMFSSVDFAGSRSIVVTATLDGKAVQVSVPASLDEQISELRYAPTDARASELANTLAQNYTWDESDGRVVADGSESLSNVVVAVRALNASGHELRSRVLAQGSSR